MKNYNKEWRAKNPQKVRAHWIVGNAIRSGKLKKEPCEVCGDYKSHAHHHDYSSPLDIKWLCHKCHWIEHGWVKSPSTKKPTKRDEMLEVAVKLKGMDKSYGQIAKELGISKGTAYKWLNVVEYD